MKNSYDVMLDRIETTVSAIKSYGFMGVDENAEQAKKDVLCMIEHIRSKRYSPIIIDFTTKTAS